jgi:hypothetical protein
MAKMPFVSLAVIYQHPKFWARWRRNMDRSTNALSQGKRNFLHLISLMSLLSILNILLALSSNQFLDTRIKWIISFIFASHLHNGRK